MPSHGTQKCQHLGWLAILPEFWVMELITGGAAEWEGATLEWARKLGAQQTDTDYTLVLSPSAQAPPTLHSDHAGD